MEESKLNMTKLVLSLICILLLVLDNSSMPFFSIHGAYPSTLFTFAIIYALLKDKKEAVFIGVVSGMLQDIYFFQGFGINSLINLFLCLLASTIGDSIVKNKRLVPTISIFIITIIKYVLIFVIFYLIDIKVDFDIMKFLISALENAILLFFFYKVVSKKIENNNLNQQWRFK